MKHHPGVYIRDELKARNWTQEDLAVRTGLLSSTISCLVRGTSAITIKNAIAISKAFGTDPEVWLKLQMVYDLRRAGYRSES